VLCLGLHTKRGLVGNAAAVRGLGMVRGAREGERFPLMPRVAAPRECGRREVQQGPLNERLTGRRCNGMYDWRSIRV